MAVTDPTERSLRASDADRDGAVEQLRDHLAAGRLSMEEFDERVGAAYQARTAGELAETLRELPAPADAAADTNRRTPSRRARAQWALWRFGTVNGICIGIWAAGGAHQFWPAFVLIPTGVVTLRRVCAPQLHGHPHHSHGGSHHQAPPQRRDADPPAAARRAVVTVVFLDIVDSTRRAAAMGDAAWRRLADDYERVVESAVAGGGGEMLFTRGDEMVAAFQLPAQAVATATRIRERVNALDVQIRAGIHAGEVDRLGPRAEGIVMHIGRRICEAAAPDEVLVSSTVRDLVVGAGMTFTDAGDHELKGLDGTFRLYAAT